MTSSKIRLFTPEQDAKAGEASRLRAEGVLYNDIAARLGYADGLAAQNAVLQYSAEHGLYGTEPAPGPRDDRAQGYFARCLAAVAARDAA